MPTLKPRISVVLAPSRAAALRQFAADHDLTVSELVAAIVEPVAQEIAFEIAHRPPGEEDQPTLFPDALIELYREEPFFEAQDAWDSLQRAFHALRANRASAASLGFQGAREAASEDGATAPPAAANDAAPPPLPRRPTPGSNTGVTSSPKGGSPRQSPLKGGARR